MVIKFGINNGKLFVIVLILVKNISFRREYFVFKLGWEKEVECELFC